MDSNRQMLFSNGSSNGKKWQDARLAAHYRILSRRLISQIKSSKDIF
jgi:hypothetical protein